MCWASQRKLRLPCEGSLFSKNLKTSLRIYQFLLEKKSPLQFLLSILFITFSFSPSQTVTLSRYTRILTHVYTDVQIYYIVFNILYDSKQQNRIPHIHTFGDDLLSGLYLVLILTYSTSTHFSRLYLPRHLFTRAKISIGSAFLFAMEVFGS